MTAVYNQDFKTFAGDDVLPQFTVQDSAGNSIDISTVIEITWWCQSNADVGTVPVVTRKMSLGQISFVTNGADGKFQVDLPASVTSTLDGMYQHLASITDAAGKVTTVTVGRMQVGVRPTWTYNPQQLATSSLFQVRRILGDIIEKDPQLQDAEIEFFITQRTSVMGAAADAARSLAAQYSRKVDVTSPGELRTAYSTQADRYRRMAKELDLIARSRGSGITPYAGGISVTDKQNAISDTDRVRPQFNIGMQDSYLPVKSVGNEVPASNPPDNPGP